MPIYTVKKDNPKSIKTWEVNCSWTELQEILLEYKLVQVLSAP